MISFEGGKELLLLPVEVSHRIRVKSAVDILFGTHCLHGGHVMSCHRLSFVLTHHCSLSAISELFIVFGTAEFGGP